MREQREQAIQCEIHFKVQFFVLRFPAALKIHHIICAPPNSVEALSVLKTHITHNTQSVISEQSLQLLRKFACSVLQLEQAVSSTEGSRIGYNKQRNERNMLTSHIVKVCTADMSHCYWQEIHIWSAVIMCIISSALSTSICQQFDQNSRSSALERLPQQWCISVVVGSQSLSDTHSLKLEFRLSVFKQ